MWFRLSCSFPVPVLSSSTPAWKHCLLWPWVSTTVGPADGASPRLWYGRKKQAPWLVPQWPWDAPSRPKDQWTVSIGACSKLLPVKEDQGARYGITPTWGVPGIRCWDSAPVRLANQGADEHGALPTTLSDGPTPGAGSCNDPAASTRHSIDSRPVTNGKRRVERLGREIATIYELCMILYDMIYLS